MDLSRLNPFGSSPQDMPVPPPSYPEHAPMYAGWEHDDMNNTVSTALDNTTLLIHIESFLSGMEPVTETDSKTGKKNTTWKSVAEPKMNQKGVRAIILELRARLDKNTIMSYFVDDDHLRAFLLNFAINLSVFLGRNMDEFEIKDNYLSEVAWFIIDNVEVTLYRGLHGNEKQGVYKQSRRIENYTVPLNSPSMMQAQRSQMFRP